METALYIGYLILGFLLIVKGGDKFVDSASSFCKKLGLSELLVGATVVSIGTTLPETLVSITGAISGKVTGDASFTDMALGNAMGSMVCNLGLVLGVMLTFNAGEIPNFKSKAWMFVCYALLSSILVIGGVGMIKSIILLAAFACYVVYNVVVAKKASRLTASANALTINADRKGLSGDIVVFLVSAGAVALGSKLLVDGGIGVARIFHLPAGIVGITVLAVGTSLPELVTAIAAIKKKKGMLSLGNIIGANIINGTFLIGMVGAISGRIQTGFITACISVPLYLFMTAVLCLPLLLKKKTYRVQGGLLLFLYAVYIGLNMYFAF